MVMNENHYILQATWAGLLSATVAILFALLAITVFVNWLFRRRNRP